MKFISRLWILMMVALGVQFSPAQTNSDDWMRVQSDDGEFSIEVPANNRFFFNADGFEVSQDQVGLQLKNMYMLNAFAEEALVSFEVYDCNKGAIQALFEHDALDKQGRKVNEIKVGELKIKQVINTTDKYYSIRWFFNTKKHGYILTTASRTGEVPAMRRFLDSLVMSTDAASSTQNSAVFSSLKKTDIRVELDDDAKPSPAKGSPPKTPDPNIKPYVMIRAPRASYVQAARDNRVTGTISLKLELGTDGFVPKLTVKRSLPQGLLRQTMFAALRAKFISKEKDGSPIVTFVTMEYGFDIY